MKVLKQLFDNNIRWAEVRNQQDPHFFQKLSEQHSPKYLWIGCSDSRVPANEIVGLDPGELFVHRNVGNIVLHTDLNCLSVLQYAIDILKVEHIIICGHYGCGGIQAAMCKHQLGLIDNWLRGVKDIYRKNQAQLDAIPDDKQRMDMLCEMNIAEQVYNVSHTTIVQAAWQRGQSLAIHGWVYRIQDGRLHDLDLCVTAMEQIESIYRIKCHK